MLDLKRELLHSSIQHWLNYEFLTWRWFLKLFILAFVIFIFYKLVNRKRILEVVAYGLLVSLISTLLDIIGTYAALWEYPTRILPLEFSELHDIFVIPIIFMLVYQHYNNWKSFIIANMVISAVASFVMEPFFTLLNFYQPITWIYIYSLPIYFAIGVLCKYIVGRLKSKSMNTH